jgi:hypothetical protein
VLPFGKLLYHHLANARPKIGVREFARRAGIPPSMMSKLHNAQCPMPQERAADWADLLGLDGEPRREFLFAAGLTHAPTVVREGVDDLHRSVKQWQRRAAQLERELQRALDDARRLG